MLIRAIFIFVMSISVAYSTTFTPVTIKKQIQTSDVIVVGEVQTKSSYVEDGQIYSKIEMLANKWIGHEFESAIIELHYPGGVVGDNALKVHGSPQFDIGEKVAVMAKWYQDKLWVKSLGLGKFSVKKIGKSYVLVNQVYPRYPRVGQMEFNKFLSLVERVKKQKVIERQLDKYELAAKRETYKKASEEGRGLASIGPAKKQESKLSAFWLVFLLGCLGILQAMIRNKYFVSEKE